MEIQARMVKSDMSGEGFEEHIWRGGHLPVRPTYDALRLATRAVHVVPVLVVVALLLFPRTATADPVQRSSSSESQTLAAAKTGMPYGISAVNSIDAHRVGKLFDTSVPTLNAYSNPNTSEVTFRTSWADIEPREGQLDFSKIDTVFASAEKNGKWVELILIPGFWNT